MNTETGLDSSDMDALFRSDEETDGHPELPPGSRLRVQQALERMLIDQEDLVTHRRMLHRLQRERHWSLRHEEPLSDDQTNRVLVRGLHANAVTDRELAQLALNEVALVVLYGVILERVLGWCDEEDQRALAEDGVLFPEQSAWGDIVAREFSRPDPRYPDLPLTPVEERITKLLRKEILTGKLQDSEPLSAATLSEQFGINPAAAKEILDKLSRLGPPSRTDIQRELRSHGLLALIRQALEGSSGGRSRPNYGPVIQTLFQHFGIPVDQLTVAQRRELFDRVATEMRILIIELAHYAVSQSPASPHSSVETIPLFQSSETLPLPARQLQRELRTDNVLTINSKKDSAQLGAVQQYHLWHYLGLEIPDVAALCGVPTETVDYNMHWVDSCIQQDSDDAEDLAP